MQKELFARIKVGDVVEGTVKNVTDFGAFIDLGGADGLLHISEMSWGRVENPKKVFNVGDTVKVLIKDINGEKIALSLKFPEANPWLHASEKYAVGNVVKGKVARMTDFGAFVDINGIDGLLPISEISWQRIKHPSDVLTLGDTIEVKIIKIDNELKRISLSLKRMGENPWQQIEGQFEEGQIVKGTVNKVTTFGAFINIFPGVEALLPVSEMSDENVNPFNMFKVGSEVDVLIKKFTPKEHRIALSVKDIK